MTRSGELMLLDVTWPRWAGAIQDTVQWVGSVVVDGDLTVEPEGVLMIHPGTRVRIAGSDRLSAGVDPEQVELLIRGGLEIGRFVLHDAVGSGGGVSYVKVLPDEMVFEGLNPGDRWYGVVLEPEPGRKIWITEDTYQIRDAERGFVVSKVQLDEPGLFWDQQLIDAPRSQTAGNGDGRLDPGEAFQLEVDITNGSLASHTRVTVKLSWDTDLLFPTWMTNSLVQPRQVVAEPFALYPGGTHRLQLPSLMLNPGAETGNTVELFLEIDDGVDVRLDTLRLEILGDPLAHEVEWKVPGRSVFGRTLVIPGRESTAVRVRVDENVRAVDLITVRGLQPVAEILMERESDVDGELYAASVQLNQAGMHRFYLRLHRIDGAVVLHPDPLHVWSAREVETNAALVFAGSGYEGRNREKLKELLTERLEGIGLQPEFVDGAPADAGFYQALLPHYRGEQNAVIWLGDTLGVGAQQAMREFLNEDGRLFLISSRLHLSPGIEPFMDEMLRARAGEPVRA